MKDYLEYIFHRFSALQNVRIHLLLAFQCCLAGLLICVSIYIWNYSPFEGIYADGVWNAKFADDPLHVQRYGIIIFGLLSSLLCVFLFVLTLLGDYKFIDQMLSFSFTITSLYLGWNMYPFWANGVGYSMMGFVPYVDLDPKALIPMIWIGDFWRIPSLAILILSLLSIPLIACFSFVNFFRKKFLYGCLFLLLFLVNLVSRFLFPGYLRWIMD